jgi:hypothetical protein
MRPCPPVDVEWRYYNFFDLSVNLKSLANTRILAQLQSGNQAGSPKWAGERTGESLDKRINFDTILIRYISKLIIIEVGGREYVRR